MSLEEFNEQVSPFRMSLFRFAKSIVHNQAVAENVVQDVYLKLWLRRDELHHYDNLQALAMTITKNLSLNQLSSEETYSKHLKVLEDDGAYSPPTPQDLLEAKDASQSILGLIALLPDQQRMVIHLRDIESCDYNEIEQITGFDKNYIRVNLSRARKWVREELKKIEDYDRTRN